MRENIYFIYIICYNLGEQMDLLKMSLPLDLFGALLLNDAARFPGCSLGGILWGFSKQVKVHMHTPASSLSFCLSLYLCRFFLSEGLGNVGSTWSSCRSVPRLGAQVFV